MHLLALYIFCICMIFTNFSEMVFQNKLFNFQVECSIFYKNDCFPSSRLYCMLLICYVFVLLHIIIEFENKDVRTCYFRKIEKWLFSMVSMVYQIICGSYRFTLPKSLLINDLWFSGPAVQTLRSAVLHDYDYKYTEYTTCDKMALFA